MKAALDSKVFSVFRRHRKYISILEHVNRKRGEEYLKITMDDFGLSEDEVMDAIAPLQSIGQPKLHHIKGLPYPVSTTSLRYLKVALEIKLQRGSQLGHIVEIGCGHGGAIYNS